MTKESHIAPAIKLSFVNPQSDSRSVLGKGVVTLMRNIEKTGSLNKAAKNLNMAYSKAWRILKNTSDAFGCELVKSVRPTGSVLTEEGKLLLELYEKMDLHLRREADKFFLELLLQYKLPKDSK